MHRHQHNPVEDKNRYPLVQPVQYQDMAHRQPNIDTQDFLAIKRQLKEALRNEKKNFVKYSLDKNQQGQVLNIMNLYEKCKISTCTQNFMNQAILKYFKWTSNTKNQNNNLDLLIILRYATKFCDYQSKPQFGEQSDFLTSVLSHDTTLKTINDMIKQEIFNCDLSLESVRNYISNIHINVIDDLSYSQYGKHDGETILALMLKLYNYNKREYTNFTAVLNGTRDLAQQVTGKLQIPNSRIYLGCFMKYAKSIGYSLQWLEEFVQLLEQERLLTSTRIGKAETQIEKFIQENQPEIKRPTQEDFTQVQLKKQKKEKQKVISAAIKQVYRRKTTEPEMPVQVQMAQNDQILVTEVNDESSDYSQKSQFDQIQLKPGEQIFKANPNTFAATGGNGNLDENMEATTIVKQQFQALYPGQQILKFKYKQQLEEIKMMGFDFQDDHILNILDQHSGNMDRTIDKLIN